MNLIETSTTEYLVMSGVLEAGVASSGTQADPTDMFTMSLSTYYPTQVIDCYEEVDQEWSGVTPTFPTFSSEDDTIGTTYLTDISSLLNADLTNETFSDPGLPATNPPTTICDVTNGLTESVATEYEQIFRQSTGTVFEFPIPNLDVDNETLTYELIKPTGWTVDVQTSGDIVQFTVADSSDLDGDYDLEIRASVNDTFFINIEILSSNPNGRCDSLY